MKLLSIIVPVYNEERTILQVIHRLETTKLPSGIEREIIVINDGSTDNTKALLESYTDRHVVINSKNTGKGGAVRKGFKLAKGNFIVVQDADLEQDPSDFNALINPIISGEADVVFGSRFIGNYKPLSLIMSLHYLLNVVFTKMSNIISGNKTTDVWTGYKMYSRNSLDKILPYLSANGIEFELEVAVILGKMKFRVVDVPISYDPRWYSEGKKTNWRQALISLMMLIRFSFRKY